MKIHLHYQVSEAPPNLAWQRLHFSWGMTLARLPTALLAPILLALVGRGVASPTWCSTTLTGSGNFNLSPSTYGNNMDCSLRLTASQPNQVGCPLPRNGGFSLPAQCPGSTPNWARAQTSFNS